MFKTCIDPSLNVPVAVKDCVWPGAIVGFEGVTVIAVNDRPAAWLICGTISPTRTTANPEPFQLPTGMLLPGGTQKTSGIATTAPTRELFAPFGSYWNGRPDGSRSASDLSK